MKPQAHLRVFRGFDRIEFGEGDTHPVLSMKTHSNPCANASREVRHQSEQLRPTEAQAFRARRAERLQACEVRRGAATGMGK